MQFAHLVRMAISPQLKRYAGRRITRRLSRSLPWIGGAVALLTVSGAMRRKGIVGGALHTILDAIPFVGGMKNAAEVVRGRDFVPDKQRRFGR